MELVFGISLNHRHSRDNNIAFNKHKFLHRVEMKREMQNIEILIAVKFSVGSGGVGSQFDELFPQYFPQIEFEFLTILS